MDFGNLKKIVFAIMFFICNKTQGFGQKSNTFEDSLSTTFAEVKAEIQKNSFFWKTDLYGPILFVNPDTRQVFANVKDSILILKPNGKIFTGFLPIELNIANTATNWAGKRWAMIMLPLPISNKDKVNLIAHELFHVKQPSLGFVLNNPNNNHLDEKNGRIYLQLELQALLRAIKTTSKTLQKNHLTNALIFRKYRHSLYPKADSTENDLELNEGLAEYTGFKIANRNTNESIKHFEDAVNDFIKNPTFVRSFAYQTIPTYGYLLSKKNKNWHNTLSKNTNLTDYFIEAFGLKISPNLQKEALRLQNRYNWVNIKKQEDIRESKRLAIVAKYKDKFVIQPHFELPFEQMQVAFDPGNITPIEELGTVYPNLRITDNWGILKVENGALISNNWDKLSLSLPTKTEGSQIFGDGWQLQSNPNYTLQKVMGSENLILTKK